MGEPNEVRAGRGEFHENPSACICEDSTAREKRDSGHRKHGKVENLTRKEEVLEDQNTEEEPEWDVEEDDEQGGLQEKGLNEGLGVDDDTLTPEEPELEDILSD